jgi:hypothetical protein
MLKADIIFYVACGCALIALLAIFGWKWSEAGREDASPTRVGVAGQFMELKSRAIAELREGLTTENYRRMKNGISRLHEVSVAASWFLPDEQYGDSGDNFREILNQIRQEVDERDLPSAKKTFTELTDSCIACHQREGNVPLDNDLQASGTSRD